MIRCLDRYSEAMGRMRGSVGRTIPRWKRPITPGSTPTLPEELAKLERQIEFIAVEHVPFIPLGRYLPRVAWSRALSDPGKGPAPTFWNVSKS